MHLLRKNTFKKNKKTALGATALLLFAVASIWFFAGQHRQATAEAVYNALLVSDGAVAHWSFDEVSGTVEDIIGSRDGTVFNTPVRQQDTPLGSGYLFTAADIDAVDLPNATLNAHTQGALEFVVKPSSTSVASGAHIMFAQYDNSTTNNLLNIGLESGKVRLNVRGNSSTNTLRMTGATTLVAGDFYHIVVQMDASSGAKIYVNGVEDLPYTFTNGSASTTGWFNFSSSSASPAKYRIGAQAVISTAFDGVIDELSVYNAPKSAAVWLDHYEEVFAHPELVATPDLGTAFLKEGGDPITYTLSLSYFGSGPASPVTVNIVPDDPLLEASPSSVVFTTGSEQYTISLIADDNGSVEGMRTISVAHTASSSDTRFNNATANLDVRLTDAFVLWGFSDPHVNTDLTQGSYLSLETAVKDTLGTTGTGHGFNWDLAVVLGDVTGDEECPGPAQFTELVNQFASTGVNRNLFYTVVGNHDFGDNRDHAYVEKYLDPLGTHTATSNVDASQMPYPILPGAEFDHYAFEFGNVLFLMLGDRNDADYPFGRTCGSSFLKDDGSHGIDGVNDGRGHPAGTYTLETYNWWVDQIENNPDKIIITTAHHQLLNTGARSGIGEGVLAPEAPHGNHGWADAAGSGFIYTMWDEDANTYTTIDCLDKNQNPIPGCDGNSDGLSDVGFRQYLDAHPGAIDMWLYGHTHAYLTPDSTYNGRSLIEQVDGVTFVNLLAVSRFHGANVAPFSRTFDFLEGLDELPIKSYRHYSGWNSGVGFYQPAETTITLSKAFMWPDVTISTATPSTITQEDTPATYTVVLATQPTAGETVVITPDTTSTHVEISPATLTFDSTNWDTPQTVTLQAVEDASEIIGSEGVTITHTISSGDYQYDNLTLGSVAITVEPVPDTAPDAPTGLAAVGHNADADLSWSAPLDDGGSAITDYIVEYKLSTDVSWATFSDGTSTATTTTVTSLTNGLVYNFRVSAVNAIGTSSPSSTASATPTAGATAPDAPTIGTATAGNAQATVTFTPPVDDGGSAITTYTVTSNPGAVTATDTGSPITVTGLANGTTYTFTVTATNAIGTSLPSAASNAVTPATIPDAPTNLSATSGNAEVDLDWDAPVSNGGSAITDYVIQYKLSSEPTTWSTFSDGTSTVTTTTVTGLTNELAYDFRVSAVNAVGTSAVSSTDSATPTAGNTAPDAPTALAAIADDAEVSLSWSAPADDGGSAITDYIVQYKLSSDSSWTTFSDGTSTVTSATVTGLTNDLSYDFRVSAVNAIGTSSPSLTDSATPEATPISPTPTPTPIPRQNPPQPIKTDIPGYVPTANTPCAPGDRYSTATGAPCASSPLTPLIPPGTFTRNLTTGDTGPDVRALQHFLNTHGFPIATAGSGSLGNETQFFGALTKAALIRFQEAYAAEILAPLGLARGTGYFGEGTRNFILKHF